MCFKPRSSRALLLAALPALVLALAACGKKGDPLPALRDVPLRANDLSVFQQGRLIVLELTYPATTIAGMPLGGIDALELLELVKPVTGAAPEPAAPAEETAPAEPAEVAPAEPAEETAPPPPAELAVTPVDAAEFQAGAQVLLALRGTELAAAVVGERILIRVPLADELPAAPQAHYFGVRTLKGKETSEVSNLVGLIPREPPPPPQNLQATAKARSIELTWDNAAEVEGFDVFRREASERAYGAAIRRLAGDERSFRDTGVEYGKSYIYTVRAIADLDPPILSAEAGEREIDYQDRFAPPRPKSFVALGERSRVRLRWEASADDDVAGYVLHRREPRRDEFHRVNDELITGVEYLDRGLVSGFTYEYRIQAVDQTGNEGELSEPVSATVR